MSPPTLLPPASLPRPLPSSPRSLLSSRSSPPPRRDPPAKAPRYDGESNPSGHAHAWQPGEVAFLNNWSFLHPEDQKALAAYLDRGATGHPVIVLGVDSPRKPTQALITTVSSYGWLDRRKYPWQQPRHRYKNRDSWRSFESTPDVGNGRPLLRLLPGHQFPIPQASWVFAESGWVVPVSTLGRFTKPCSQHILRMEPDSLDELRAHMAVACRNWGNALVRLATAARLAKMSPPPAPAAVLGEPPVDAEAPVDAEPPVPAAPPTPAVPAVPAIPAVPLVPAVPALPAPPALPAVSVAGPKPEAAAPPAAMPRYVPPHARGRSNDDNGNDNDNNNGKGKGKGKGKPWETKSWWR